MRFPTILIALALPLSAGAQSLLEVYRDARTYDAQYASARYALQAGLEKLPQGRALILPTLNLSANTLGSRLDTNSQPAVGRHCLVRNSNSGSSPHGGSSGSGLSTPFGRPVVPED